MRYDTSTPQITRTKTTPRLITGENAKALVGLGVFLWTLIFGTVLFLLMFVDQQVKDAGMMLKSQLMASSCGASIGMLVIALGIPAVLFIGRMARDLLLEIEEETDTGPNREMEIGYETKILIPTGPHEWRGGEYKVQPELLVEWAQAATSGGSLAFNVWEDQWPKGQKGYAAFRKKLKDQGRINVLSNGQIELSDEGWKFFRYIARVKPSQLPPPHQTGVPQLPAYTGDIQQDMT